jgi:hypothetical protein
MKKKKAKVSEPKKPVKQVELAAPPPSPSLLPSDPGATRKRNEKWFSSLNETVPTVQVVSPPLAGPPITVIPGFTVPCICKGSSTYLPPLPGPVCGKCGGRGYVVVEKG